MRIFNCSNRLIDFYNKTKATNSVQSKCKYFQPYSRPKTFPVKISQHEIIVRDLNDSKIPRF